MSEAGAVEETQNGLSPVERKVLNNFFWSFHHSQGNPTLQTLLSIYVARLYDKAEIGDIDAFEARIKPHIERLKVPSEHLRKKVNKATGKTTILDDKVAQEDEAGFQGEWGRLMVVFTRVFYDKPDVRFMNWMGGYEGDVYKASELTPDQFMYQVVDHMVNADLDFQRKPREHRKEGSDPHSSHLQLYLFADKPTQSLEYEKLYSDIANFLREIGIVKGSASDRKMDLREEQIMSLKVKFQSLIQEWEHNHPGKQFIPNKPAD